MGKHYIIAREGWLPIATTVVLGAVVQNFLGLYWALPLWFCALALLYLYRDPNRVVPSLPLAIVSPLDGIVRQIRAVECQRIE